MALVWRSGFLLQIADALWKDSCISWSVNPFERKNWNFFSIDELYCTGRDTKNSVAFATYKTFFFLFKYENTEPDFEHAFDWSYQVFANVWCEIPGLQSVYLWLKGSGKLLAQTKIRQGGKIIL